MIGAAAISLMLQCVVHADGGFEAKTGSANVPVSFEVRDADFVAAGHPDLKGLTDNEIRRIDGGSFYLMGRYKNLPNARLEVFVGPAVKGTRRLSWSQLEARGVNGALTLEDMVSGTCDETAGTKGLGQ